MPYVRYVPEVEVLQPGEAEDVRPDADLRLRQASARRAGRTCPYRAVATLVLPPQDPYSPDRRVYADDVLSFNPWHGLVEHQPLGSIQRVRKPVYDDSADDRHHYNAVARHEPDSIQTLPA